MRVIRVMLMGIGAGTSVMWLFGMIGITVSPIWAGVACTITVCIALRNKGDA